MRAALVVLGWLLAAAAAAADEPRFVRAWELAPAADSAVWRVVLDEEVLSRLHRADARDLRIVDARGLPVPFLRLPSEALLEEAEETLSLAIESTLIDRDDPAPAPLQLDITQGDTRVRVQAPGVVQEIHQVGELIFEALLGQDGEPATRPGRARLELELHSDTDPPGECWLRPAADAAPASLRVGFQRYGDTRPSRFRAAIDLDQQPRVWHLACYGRNRPGGLRLADAQMRFQRPRDHRRQLSLQLPLQTVSDASQTGGLFSFELPGPLLVRSLSLSSDELNLVSAITVESSATENGPWQRRAELVLSTVRGESGPQIEISLDHRHRHWRLRSTPALPSAPRLHLGVEAEQLAFLAQGIAPWQLQAGSLTAFEGLQPSMPPLDQLVQRIGPAWTWPELQPRNGHDLDGPAALLPAPPPRPWPQYLLWAVLGFGATIVIGFALRLLKEAPPRS